MYEKELEFGTHELEIRSQDDPETMTLHYEIRCRKCPLKIKTSVSMYVWKQLRYPLDPLDALKKEIIKGPSTCEEAHGLSLIASIMKS